MKKEKKEGLNILIRCGKRVAFRVEIKGEV